MSETRSVETTAPDIEAAIELGLAKLGVSRESVIVEILEEPSRGLLGLGARQARIRLTTAAPARGAAVPASVPVEPPAAAVSAPPSAPVVDETSYAQDEIDEAPYDEAPYDEDDEDEAYDDEDDEEDDDDSYGADAAYEPEKSASEDELDDDARVGRATLEELLGKMHITARINVYRAPAADNNEDAPWVLQIEGDDLAMLIGRRGETLSALQYITRLIASRDLQRRANIVLDVEGYKSRREQMLRGLASRMADQAIQMGRTVALEPMPPYERRIVHLALRERDDVTTESVGEGNFRKVTIIPRRR